MEIKDYGALIACPHCGSKHHINPRELQGCALILFRCSDCGTEVVHENEVAKKIAAVIATIRVGLSRMKI